MLKISVIMGIYNTNNEMMVKLAICSILNQTYKDFEFIICDDGSTDGTYELIEKLTRHDRRVILIRNEKNSGLAFTLNKCLQMAQGQYIARMDADDISLPTRFEEELGFIEQHKEYSFVSCNADLFDDRGIWGKRKMEKTPDKKSFLFGSPFIHAAILMERKMYMKLGGYRVSKETLRAEDYDLFMRLYATGSKGYNLQNCLYQIREDSNAYKRRVYKHRWNEAKIRYKGFKRLGLLHKGFIYVIKPLIVGLIPQRILAVLRKES